MGLAKAEPRQGIYLSRPKGILSQIALWWRHHGCGISMSTAKEVFADRYPGAAIFARLRAEGAVLCAVSPKRLMLEMTGTIPTEYLIDVLAESRAAGHLATDDFFALVDMTDFTGVLDWQVIPKISEVMPKGDSVNKNAYIVRNTMFAVLAKINMVLFPKTQHRTFATAAEARAWLGWE